MSHDSSVEVKIQNVSRRGTPASAAIPGTKEVHPQNGLDLTNMQIPFFSTITNIFTDKQKIF